jgi:hypothetical protein
MNELPAIEAVMGWRPPMLTENTQAIPTGDKHPAVEVEVKASQKERHNNRTGQALAGGDIEKINSKSWWMSKWRKRPPKKSSQSSNAENGLPQLMLRTTTRTIRPLIAAVIGRRNNAAGDAGEQNRHKTPEDLRTWRSMSEPLNERSCKQLKRRGAGRGRYLRKKAQSSKEDTSRWRANLQQALRNRVSEDKPVFSEKSTTISQFTRAPGKAYRDWGSMSISPDLDGRCAVPGDLHRRPGSGLPIP